MYAEKGEGGRSQRAVEYHLTLIHLFMPQSINSFVSPLGFCREVAQPGRASEFARMTGRRRRCRSLPMVGIILACSGDNRNRTVAGSNPALPTKNLAKNALVLGCFQLLRRYKDCSDTAFFRDFIFSFTPSANRIGCGFLWRHLRI